MQEFIEHRTRLTPSTATCKSMEQASIEVALRTLKTAYKLARRNGDNVVNARDLQAAIRMIFPTSIADVADANVTRAVAERLQYQT